MSSPNSPAASDSQPPTPRGKVQALLAQFSDSDTDDAPAGPRRELQKSVVAQKSSSTPTSDQESDDDVPVARKSRMAARLNAASNAGPQETGQTEQNADKASNGKPTPPRASDSSDELSRPAPRRRLLTKRKSSPAVPSSPPPQQAVSDPASPLFFPSPTRSAAGSKLTPADDDAGEEARNESHASTDKSRFKALVEKQRKIREEKEAAEQAKRAARQQSAEATSVRRPRGSSPADDSHESSDGSNADAAQKIARATKPTRKASKKAVEEMKRETQRMSRNMQLAHQAQVKKRFTKDSFLARFNRQQAAEAILANPAPSSSRSPSPGPASEVEQTSRHTTPPTSPIEEFGETKQTTEQTAQANESPKGLGLVLEAPTLAEIGLEAPTDTSKGKGKAGSGPIIPDQEVQQVALARDPISTTPAVDMAKVKVEKKSKIAELLKQSRASSVEDDEDSLEIVTSKGDMRRYAAFERLPKRKAKEAPSHLALRSLAQINAGDRRDRSTITAAEMQANLRRAAREQAQKERQDRIDELRAKGVIIQSVEERERDQQEVEDLVEKARQEAAEISKREKEAAKKDGTFVKDGLDDDDDSAEDEDYATDDDAANMEEDGSDEEDENMEHSDDQGNKEGDFFNDEADEASSEEDSDQASDVEIDGADTEDANQEVRTPAPRKPRNLRVLSDDEDEAIETDTPNLAQLAKTPQSLLRSTRKQIPGLQMSDDTPLGLTQAFDATMADSQTQDETEAQDSIDYVADLPSPGLAMVPRLNRLESLDMVSDSQPASQVQPLNISLSFSQSQRVPESPSLNRRPSAVQVTPSQVPFEPTQDEGYVFSPFHGNRFSETPRTEPHSTVETLPLKEAEASPIVQRRNRLRRGRAAAEASDLEDEAEGLAPTAFEVMQRAAKRGDEPFDKTKSKARDIVDEAAEESDDEYAGLGGASDDENGADVENDDDRRMIDLDTQVGKGDEAALAGYHADRERKKDEADVSKLLQDITTGKLRRRRGGNDELDLSDEEDAVARKREAKRREFARMRRELLKNEAVGKIAEDKKKEAFLQSLEDRRVLSDDDDFDEPETEDSQSQSQSRAAPEGDVSNSADVPVAGTKRKRALDPSSDDRLNRLPPAQRRSNINKKPATLVEIRENLSFLVEEPDSQTASIDLGLSDSEDEPEKYVDLDRHARAAEMEEAAEEEDGEGLGDFIVDDEDTREEETDNGVFKKPTLPASTSNLGRDRLESAFAHRRSTTNVVNRLSMLRQSSSSGSSNKMAFSTTATKDTFKVPNLLRRATTNSSFSSLSSNESMSATGVVTTTSANKTERGHVSEDKVFVRKGNTGRRNAVNFQQGERPESKMSQRAGVSKKSGAGGAGKAVKRKGGFLGDLLGRGNTWG